MCQAPALGACGSSSEQQGKGSSSHEAFMSLPPKGESHPGQGGRCVILYFSIQNLLNWEEIPRDAVSVFIFMALPGDNAKRLGVSFCPLTVTSLPSRAGSSQNVPCSGKQFSMWVT